MNPLLDQVRDEIRSSWRFRWLAAAITATVALTGWLIVFALPDQYEAVASVFVDTRTALRPALQGLALEQDVDAQLNLVRQSLLAGPQLRQIAQQAGVLPTTVLDARSQENLLTDMAKRIAIGVHSASGSDEDRNAAGSIYRIAYQDSNRARSLRVTTILLDTLITETLGGKRAGSENAQQFLETQIRDYEKRLRAAEDRLAVFKTKHIGLMPTEQGGYFAQLQKESEAAVDTRTKLAEAQSRRAALTRQLHGDAAIAAAGSAQTTTGAGGVAVGVDTLGQIAQAQAQLDELLLKFTEKHPDVIAAHQRLEELKKRRAAEVEALKRGDATVAAESRASANPVYQSIQLALNQVDVEIADLNTELEQHLSKAAELRKRLDTAPQVEAEFAQLNRDYDVNKAEYTALLGNLQKARLGERADSAGSVRFEVVQPPTASFQPVWPRRALWLTEILFLGLVAGAGVAYGLHYLQPVVSSSTALTQSVGLPVLGLVSTAFPTRRRLKRRREMLRLSLAGGFLIAGFVLAVILSQAGYRISAVALKHLVSL